MKLGLFVSPLGGIAPPFGHSEKGMAVTAALIGAGAALAGGIGSNIANGISTSNTNQTNMEIAKMNNETSQKQYEETMKWLQEQFYKQRQFSLEDRSYNSIGQTVQRALAAGINPSAIVGNGQSQGQSVSSVGAPSPSVLQAPHIMPQHFDFTGLSEGIGRAVDAFYENRLRQKQAEGLEYDNQIKAATAATAFWREMQQIRNLMADTDEKLSRLPKNSAEYQETLARKESIERDLWERIDNYNERRKQLENSNKLMARQEQHIGVEEAQAWTEIGIKRALANSQIQLNSENLKVFESVAAKNWEEAKNEFYRRGSVKEAVVTDKIHNELLKQYQGEKIRELGYRNSDVWHRDAWDLANYLSGAILQGLQTIPKYR